MSVVVSEMTLVWLGLSSVLRCVRALWWSLVIGPPVTVIFQNEALAGLGQNPVNPWTKPPLTSRFVKCELSALVP